MGKNAGKIRLVVEYCAARAAVAALAALPLDAAVRVGRRLGGLARLLDRGHRERVHAQAAERLGLAGRELDDFVKANFHAYGMAFAEFARLSRMRAEDFGKHVDGLPEFGALVHSLLAEGRGLIFVTAHFGNWEWCNSCARPLGLSGGSIARPLDNPRLNEFVRSIRERNGLRIFDKQGAIRKALGALRDNKLVGVLIDQDAGKKGMMSPFLGRPASTITVPVELAIRTGCPMLVVGLRRNSGGARRAGAKRFAMLFGAEPHRPNPDAGAKEEARRLTDALNDSLGRMIMQAPEQWFWIHRRWKSAGRE